MNNKPNDPDFSYQQYGEILQRYKPINCDYLEALDRDSFAVLRHDVEFSPWRALELAKIDKLLDVCSTFLFQVESNAYNIFSQENRRRLAQIEELGLHIGLHFYVPNLEANDWQELGTALKRQADLLSQVTHAEITRFSYHRPPKWVLVNRSNYVGDYLNLYGGSFFEYSGNPQNIKYIADSRHRYDYGHPLDEYSSTKFHLLFHPDEWASEELDEDSNFESLAAEHLEEFERTLEHETPRNYLPYRQRKIL